VPTVVPTPVPTAVIQEPKIAAIQPKGTLVWRDDTARTDAASVTTEDLPRAQTEPALGVWLRGGGESLFIGALDASGKLIFASAEQQNLIADYSSVVVARGSSDTAADQPLLQGSLPEKALLHIRHVLSSIAVTPNSIGFGVGLRQETDELLRHAQFLTEALDEGNLALEKLHAEHLVNLIEGAEGDHFGDLNRNGKIDNPGDGYGVLENGAQDGYIKGMRDHAQLAADAADATDDIKLHAGHVRIAGENTRQRTTEIRDRALAILQARGLNDTRGDAQKLLSLAHQTIQGLDLNGDEQVAPVPGEGGAAVAYQHAQLMAAIGLKRPSASAAVAPEPAAAPVAPTPGPAAAAEHAHVPSATRVNIGDNTFAPKTLTVPKGSVVVWSQVGQRPHTVTADDGAFGSELMRNGETFEHRFSEPGTYLYFCELHGGPGGAGMAAQVTVE
jgi:plastocyanin